MCSHCRLESLLSSSLLVSIHRQECKLACHISSHYDRTTSRNNSYWRYWAELLDFLLVGVSHSVDLRRLENKACWICVSHLNDTLCITCNQSCLIEMHSSDSGVVGRDLTYLILAEVPDNHLSTCLGTSDKDVSWKHLETSHRTSKVFLINRGQSVLGSINSKGLDLTVLWARKHDIASIKLGELNCCYRPCMARLMVLHASRWHYSHLEVFGQAKEDVILYKISAP